MKKILTALLLCLATMANAQENENIEEMVWKCIEPHYSTDTISGENSLEQHVRLVKKYVPDDLMGERHLALRAEESTKYPSGMDVELYRKTLLSGVTTDSLREKINRCFDNFKEKYGHLAKGKPAPDIEFTDKEGKIHHLSEYKGKVLFVDIWGTWCAPCIAEFPHLRAIQEHFKDNPDVMIMSLSCDIERKPERWLPFLQQRGDEITWHQFMLTKEGNKVISDVYYIFGIPHFMLIDKEGNFVSYDGPHPSLADPIKEIEKVLQK